MENNDRPVIQDRRLLYVAPLVIGVLVLLIGAISVFYRPVVTETPATSPTSTKPFPKQVPSPPVSKPSALTRADLITYSREAADQFTFLGHLPTAKDPLLGRNFTVRIPFGCAGIPSEYSPTQISKTYNADGQSITLTATPGIWTTLPVLEQAVSDTDVETVEGFWLPRPWTNSDACPAQTDYPIPPTPTPPTGQILGLAELFTAGSSRVSRHADHPYVFSRKSTSGDSAVLNHSYRLVLEGKIVGFKDGHSLHCWTEAPDHHPLCVYSVEFNRVSFEDSETNEKLVNWSD